MSDSSENTILTNVEAEGVVNNSTSTKECSYYVPHCKLIKILFRGVLENIVRRLTLIVYSSSLTLNRDNVAQKIAYDMIVKDVTEIAIYLGVTDEVAKLLESMVHEDVAITDDEGLVSVFHE